VDVYMGVGSGRNGLGTPWILRFYILLLTL